MKLNQKRIEWNEIEIEKLKELHRINMSYKKMSTYLKNRTACSIKHKASELGLISNYRFKRYSHNENFWEIPNEMNSYWAGFFAADGCLAKSSNSDNYSFLISLASKDIHHLEKLKKCVDYTGDIRTRIKKDCKSVSTLQIHSIKKWKEDMAKIFSIEPIKTFRIAPPNLNNNILNFCYLLGYLDGDGSIVFPKGRSSFNISVVSCSKNILDWIKNILDKEFPIKYRRPTFPKVCFCPRGWYSFAIGGLRAAVILDYLRQFPVPKLSRKWDKPNVLEYVEQQKLKYPHLFKKFIPTPPIPV